MRELVCNSSASIVIKLTFAIQGLLLPLEQCNYPKIEIEKRLIQTKPVSLKLCGDCNFQISSILLNVFVLFSIRVVSFGYITSFVLPFIFRISDALETSKLESSWNFSCAVLP